MARGPRKHKGLWMCASLHRLPVHSKPLYKGMLKSLAVFARTRDRARRLIVYSTGGNKGETLLVAPRKHGFDFKDFDLSELFPNGSTSVSIKTLPGTNMPLPTPWRIYMESGRFLAPLNASVRARFGVEWHGNLVLLKHRRESSVYVQHIARGEEDYVDVILGLWIKQFMRIKDRMGAKLHFRASA